MAEWKKILRWFVLEQSIDRVVEQTGISKYSVIKALMHLRELMSGTVPEVFSGTVEVDETYIGSHWKSIKLFKRLHGAKRGRGTHKRPVFGILCKGGKVWVTLVDNVQGQTLLPIIKE